MLLAYDWEVPKASLRVCLEVKRETILGTTPIKHIDKWPACPTSCKCIALIAHVGEILHGCLMAQGANLILEELYARSAVAICSKAQAIR